jgi:hypothetical protein
MMGKIIQMFQTTNQIQPACMHPYQAAALTSLILLDFSPSSRHSELPGRQQLSTQNPLAQPLGKIFFASGRKADEKRTDHTD